MFPKFALEMVTVRVPYPGATPKDCEEAICHKIESAIRSIDGIKNVYAAPLWEPACGDRVNRTYAFRRQAGSYKVTDLRTGGKLRG